MKTPNYIKALLQPNGKKTPNRRVWSIDLEMVWVPFFTATNVMGETAIPSEDLGAPLRLSRAKDGSVRFTQSGRPSLRVAPVLNSHVRIVRENFTASLQAYTGTVMAEREDAYKAEVETAQSAGLPIHVAQEQAIAEALRQAVAEEVEAMPEPERELVAA